MPLLDPVILCEGCLRRLLEKQCIVHVSLLTNVLFRGSGESYTSLHTYGSDMRRT